MLRRTTPPLTNAERCRRYRVNHPEKKEEFRLLMRKKRAAERLKTGQPHLRVIVPEPDRLDAGLLSLILALIESKQRIAVIS